MIPATVIGWIAGRPAVVAWLGAAAVALLLSSTFAAGMQTWRLARAQASESEALARLAREQAASAEQRRLWADESARAQAAARVREGERQAAIDAARSEVDAKREEINFNEARIAELQRNVSRLRVDRDSLFNELSAFATHASRSREDSVGACQERARGLAGLLAEGAELVAACSDERREGIELARQSAALAQVRAVRLKACIDAWPR